MHNRVRKIILLVLADIAGIGIGLCIFALFHHVLPKRIQSGTEGLRYTGTKITKESTDAAENAENQTAEGNDEPSVDSETGQVTETDFSASFPGVFSDGAVEITEDSYRSQNLFVKTTTITENHLVYYVQDIYIRQIGNIKTAFAEDTFGQNISEWPLKIATDKNAIASINGDYYGIHANGLVIRNGYVYREEPDESDDICVLYFDGSMEMIPADEVDVEQLIEKGCYQSWSFGPSLLNEDGSAKESFNSKIARANPRSAIGYYAPGHYCFVAVDGRNENGSNGATLEKLAEIMEELGCTSAYNLDGGKSSAMTFQERLVNTPCDGGREDTDIIYITE